MRTSRLDLDDYNNDTEDGCHITSMAGTWMSIVEGFAGMKVRDHVLQFNPFIPSQWNSFTFSMGFRGTQLKVKIDASQISITNFSKQEIEVAVFNQRYTIKEGEQHISYNELLV